MADDVALGLGGEEDLAGASDTNGVALLSRRPGTETGFAQSRPEAVEAEERLRLECRRGLDQRLVLIGKEGKQGHFEPGRQLVLAALARNLDCKGAAAALEDAGEDGIERFLLVRTEGRDLRTRASRHPNNRFAGLPDCPFARLPARHANSLKSTWAMTVPAMKKRRPLRRALTSASWPSRL